MIPKLCLAVVECRPSDRAEIPLSKPEMISIDKNEDDQNSDEDSLVQISSSARPHF